MVDGMFYQGSQIFSSLSAKIGLQLDQLNFLISELTSLIVAYVLRKYVPPSAENVLKRHLISIVMGIILCYFCYGWLTVHLLNMSVLTYLALVSIQRKYVHLVIFIFDMGYLSSLHVYRLIYDYGNYTVEITGGLMIMTQKLTSLAFSYYDGLKTDESLSKSQLQFRINQKPKLLEYLSYTFYFQSVLIGPLIFYQEYIDFINGNSILKHQKSQQTIDNNNNHNGISKNGHSTTNGYVKRAEVVVVQPDITKVVLKKSLVAFLLAMVYFTVTTRFNPRRNIDPDIVMQPIWYRFVYNYVSITSHRFKYYLAWQITELVHNISGLGFNGYDEQGRAKWDLCTSVDILQLETSTSMKHFLDNWNLSTTRWFRFIAYERLPSGKTLGVFLLSAFWHGFYPGYYLTFILGALAVYAGRGIRQNIRPLFIDNNLSHLYALITWLGTIWTINYAATSFLLLDFKSSIQFYNVWYWHIHVLCVLFVVILPYRRKSARFNIK